MGKMSKIGVRDPQTKERGQVTAYVVWGQNHLLQKRQFAWDGRYWYYQPTTRDPFQKVNGMDLPDNVLAAMHAHADKAVGRDGCVAESVANASESAMRFNVCYHGGPADSDIAFGLREVAGNHGNLMLTRPASGQPHWYDLPIHGSTVLEGGDMKVVRVK